MMTTGRVVVFGANCDSPRKTTGCKIGSNFRWIVLHDVQIGLGLVATVGNDHVLQRKRKVQHDVKIFAAEVSFNGCCRTFVFGLRIVARNLLVINIHDSVPIVEGW